MTALETWCLMMIGLVFQALLCYVIILFSLCRSTRTKVRPLGGTLASQVNSEGEKGSAERRDWMLETILFSWVLLTALIFNLVYWTKQRG